MLIFFSNEEFREFKTHDKSKLRYAVSNYGRIISFSDNIYDGRLLKGSLTDGYRILRFKITENNKLKHKHLFFYKLVAEKFLPQTDENKKYVIHLDYKRDNDVVTNLKRVTYQEKLDHIKKSPHVKQAMKNLVEHNIKSDGKKLTSTQVMHIKKILQNPNRKNRLKIIAKQFGISETQIKRIENGENWGHIKI